MNSKTTPTTSQKEIDDLFHKESFLKSDFSVVKIMGKCLMGSCYDCYTQDEQDLNYG